MKNKMDKKGEPNDGDRAEGWGVCPLVGWEAEIREDWNCFMLRPHYLDDPKQSDYEAFAGNRYVLSPAICRDLAKALIEAAEILEKTPQSGANRLKH